ncbi:MAG TPA: hypothetical protein VNB22_01565 [Pyrinomonadaceae bacterium]|nr:hypothetical protein [Pyrinomonadaceae bacterium]
MKDFIQWTTPSPLWETAISQNTPQARRAELSRPAILRFATDSFMDDFLKMTENDPKRLNQYIAQPETWRGLAPMPEALKPAPAFTRNLKRLGLISARKKAKTEGLTQTTDKFTAFANSQASKPLKLYQPAHQRFYLISACLVCERPGLPDKIPDNGREEKVSYVIRRLFPKTALELGEPLPPLDSTWEEYAYIITDQGARWKKVSNKNSLETDEEQQTLFSVNILEDDGRRRKIFAGVIPTGRREAYMAASQASNTDSTGSNGETDPNKPIDSRVYTMRSQFRDPWKNLLQTASYAKKAAIASDVPDEDADDIKHAQEDIIKTAREQIQTVSWLILLDFANYIKDNLPNIWDVLKTPSLRSDLSTEEEALFKVLEATKLETPFANNLKLGTIPNIVIKSSLKDALLAIKPPNDDTAAAQIEKNLETVVQSYNRTTPDALYPTFLFPLADPGYNPAAAPHENPDFLLKTTLDGNPVSITPTNFLKTSENQKVPPPSPKVTDGEDYVNRIGQLIEAALPPLPENQPLQMPPLASQTPMDMRQGWFVMRCVYERPLCGTIDPPVLSEPTKAFQIAGFFDPDAPARPIRIALPVDITPAGLRKFDRNTAFMMSDLLCGQVNRMKGITFMDLVLSVLPFPFHKGLDVPDSGGCKDGGLSIGMICSLSIPIITICALILLIIIVLLLDFIFKWMPFLMFCFPLPGLKAKDE